MSTLHSRVMRSAAWSTGGALFARFGNLFVGIVAARLLAPHDFGLFAVALVVFTFVNQVSELSIASVLIRERGSLDKAAPTALTLAISSQVLFSILLWFGAPFLARSFGAPGAVDALRVLCLFLLISGPSAVTTAQLARDFRQDLRALIDLGGLVIGSSSLIGLALLDQGEMALAWSRVLGQAFVTLALFFAVTTVYKPGFVPAQAGRLLKIGLPLVGTNIVGIAIASTAVFFIGRAMTPHDVGVYNLALTVSMWPLSLLVPLLANVGLPLLARFQHDRDQMRRLFVSSAQLISGAFWITSALLAGLSPWLVDVLYGEKWHETIPVLVIVAIACAARMLHHLMAEVLIAGGLTGRYFLLNCFFLGMLVPAMWFCVDAWGLIGAGIAEMVSSWLAILLFLVLMRPIIGANPIATLRTCVAPLACAAIAALAAHGTGRALPNSWLSLFVGGIVGTLVYAAIALPWVRRILRHNLLIGKGRHELDNGPQTLPTKDLGGVP